jgi:hypothetical protein
MEFDNFKPLFKSGIFECISWLSGSIFGDDDWGFLEDGVKTYPKAPMSPSQLANIIHYLLIYSP